MTPVVRCARILWQSVFTAGQASSGTRALALMLMLLALAGCNRKNGVGSPTGGSDVKPTQARLARKVYVAPVEERDLTYQVETVGTLEPERLVLQKRRAYKKD